MPGTDKIPTDLDPVDEAGRLADVELSPEDKSAMNRVIEGARMRKTVADARAKGEFAKPPPRISGAASFM